MELTSVSAIRGVAPQIVVEAVEAYLDGSDTAHARRDGRAPGPGDVQVHDAVGAWTTVTWPAFFAPRDLTAARVLSRTLRTVVSTVTTTSDEGWSHQLLGCGTLLDRFHSYPAGLAWDDEDVATLAQEWSGDFELVARVLGVEPCGLRRHFCQANPATRDHPGRDRDGFLGLWSAVGIRMADTPPYAVLTVDRSWQLAPA